MFAYTYFNHKNIISYIYNIAPIYVLTQKVVFSQNL